MEAQTDKSFAQSHTAGEHRRDAHGLAPRPDPPGRVHPAGQSSPSVPPTQDCVGPGRVLPFRGPGPRSRQKHPTQDPAWGHERALPAPPVSTTAPPPDAAGGASREDPGPHGRPGGGGGSPATRQTTRRTALGPVALPRRPLSEGCTIAATPVFREKSCFSYHRKTKGFMAAPASVYARIPGQSTTSVWPGNGYIFAPRTCCEY